MTAKTDDSVLVKFNQTNRTVFLIKPVLILKCLAVQVLVLLVFLVSSALKVVFNVSGE